MKEPTATLYLACGKIAAGKSTLCDELARRPRVVLIREDEWMAHLFRQELRSVADYAEYSQRLRNALTSHVVLLLREGVSVVLDFPANTLKFRRWMRELIDQSGAQHELHFLDVSDEV